MYIFKKRNEKRILEENLGSYTYCLGVVENFLTSMEDPETIKDRHIQGQAWWRGGYVRVLCLRSLGFAGSDPGHGHAHCLSSHAVAGGPCIKQRKMDTDVSSGPVFLSKKRRIGGRCQLRANLPKNKQTNKQTRQTHLNIQKYGRRYQSQWIHDRFIKMYLQHKFKQFKIYRIQRKYKIQTDTKTYLDRIVDKGCKQEILKNEKPCDKILKLTVNRLILKIGKKRKVKRNKK